MLKSKFTSSRHFLMFSVRLIKACVVEIFFSKTKLGRIEIVAFDKDFKILVYIIFASILSTFDNGEIGR